MKTGVRGLMGLVLAGVLALTGAPQAVADDVVTIPDPALAACVTRTLANARLAPDFTAQNLARLATLNCGAADGVVTDLTGLTKLVNVFSLGLRLDQELDLGALTSLSRLTTLVLTVGSAGRITVPSSLHLSTLTLASDEPGLPETSALVAGTVTVQVSAAASLDGLGPIVATSASVLGPQVDDVSALSTSSVQQLSLQVSTGASLDGVGEVAGLQSLTVARVPATYSGLAGQTTLHTLKLAGGPLLGDLATLPRLTGVTSLSIESAYLSALPDLSRFPALTSLNVSAGTAFSSLGPSGGLKALQDIWVRNTGLSDIRALSGATRLRAVNLGGNRIVDIGPLASVAAGASVSLDGNRISDVSPLAGLRLQRLNLAFNRIVDVSPLAGAPFAALDLADNEISDVSPLAGLPTGSVLTLDSNHITDFQALAAWSGVLSARGQTVSLPDVNIDFSSPVPAPPRGADGGRLDPVVGDDENPGTISDGRITYSTPGLHRWAFSNGTAGESTITVEFTQLVLPRAPFASSPQPVLPRLKVGRAVSVVVPDWSPTPEERSYQWWVSDSDGDYPIVGATSPDFTPGAELAGTGVYLEVTGHKPGYIRTRIRSTYERVAYLEYAQPPIVTLEPEQWMPMGTLLTATGNWESGTSLRFTWSRDGHTLDVHGPTYTTTAADAGHYVYVRVEISRPGYETFTPAASVGVAYAQFANRTPTISGTPRVGHVLKAKTSWPAGAVKTCKWYHYGIRIPGASSCTYKVRKSDRGKRMRVLVRVTMPGYATMERWSRLKVVH